MPRRSLWLIGMLGALGASVQAQPVSPPYAGGINVQAYPAGVIVALHGAIPLGSRDALRAYAGFNATNRRDWGEHEDERGGGPGAGIGWRHYFGAGHGGFHIGTRVDAWLLAIDWEDEGGQRAGSTSLVVLQPTAQAGYTWRLGRYAVATTAAFGAEINAVTDGEEVGQGAMVLIGVSFARRGLRN